MDFIKSILKAMACFMLIAIALIVTGVIENEAKVGALLTLYFWGLIFYFLAPYMSMIAAFPAEVTHQNSIKHEVWRFLAWLVFITAGLLWAFW